MKATVLRVRAERVESVLDRLLPVVPAGVYVEGDELLVVPAHEGLAEAVGEHLLELSERELPDDPEECAAALLRSPVVAGRFAIRAPTAPPAPAGLEEIVIERSTAFGTALHPTTQRCLELMLALEPGGSFADLGCGTGVLSIAAARLGWDPVVAVDYDEASVDSARANADRNAVTVEARRADLLAEPPPAADTVVANVPVHVHRAVRERLGRPPRRLIASGVSPDEADEVVAAYSGLGLVERRRYAQSGWAAVLLAAADEPIREAAEEADRRREQPPADAPERLPSTLAGQLETELPGGGLAFSCSRELPTGARVAAILAPGLFRVDVRHLEDTLVISVRNLSPVPLRFLPDRGPPRTIVTTAETALKRPLATNSRMRLLVGAREATITLSALSGLSPVSGRIVAQAIVGAG